MIFLWEAHEMYILGGEGARLSVKGYCRITQFAILTKKNDRGCWKCNTCGGDIGVDGTIILKLIFKLLEGAWTGLIWLKIGTDSGL
jgi:hypothetical protein